MFTQPSHPGAGRQPEHHDNSSIIGEDLVTEELGPEYQEKLHTTMSHEKSLKTRLDHRRRIKRMIEHC